MRSPSRRVQYALILTILLMALVGMGSSSKQVRAQGTEEPKRLIIDISGTPREEIKTLQDAGLISEGGTLYKNTAEGTFIQVRRQGFNYLQQFTDLAPIDFVFQFRVQLQMDSAATPGSGCGFFFRKNDFGQSYVLLTNDRHLYLAQFRKDKTIVNYSLNVDDIAELDPKHYDTDGYIHTITIIAVQDSLSFFLNGVQIVTTNDALADNGIFAILLYNVDATENQSLCTYDNLWVLDLTHYSS